MKGYVCNKLPNGLEFGGVIIATSEEEAKKELVKIAEAGSWEVNIDDIDLKEIDLTKTNAVIIDPLEQY